MKKFSRVFAAVICSISLMVCPIASIGVSADEISVNETDAITSSAAMSLTPAAEEITADSAEIAELTEKIQNLKQTQFNAGIALDPTVDAVYTNLLYTFALTKPATCRTMISQLDRTARLNTVLYLNIVNSLVGLATGNPVVELKSDTPVLNKDMGVNYYGPSGKEYYYTMPMDHIVQRIHDSGYDGEYWVRDDGVKMIGDYVMCAADFDVHPYGTLVQTSLGTAMVVDTGGFADTDPLSFDIATVW